MMKKWISKARITYKGLLMTTSIVLTTLFLLIIALQSYNSTTAYILNKIDTININIVEQQAKAIENNIIQIKKITEYLATDDILLGYLEEYETVSRANKANLNNEIKSRISIMKQFNKYVSDIVVLYDKSAIVSGEGAGEFYDVTACLISESNYSKPIENGKGQAILFSPSKNERIQQEIPIDINYWASSYCFGCAIEGDGRTGYLFVLVDSTLFEDLGSGTFLVDEENTVVGVSEDLQAQMTETILEKGLAQANSETVNIQVDNNKYYYKFIDLVNMKLVYVQNHTQLSESIVEYRRYLLIVLTIAVIFAFFLSRIISAQIIHPLRKLIQFMKNYVYDKREAQPQKGTGGWQGLSIRESITGYLIGVIIIPVGIYLIATYFISVQVIESYVTTSCSIAFDQTVDNIEYYLDTKDKIMKNIIFNITVQEALYADGDTMQYAYEDIIDKGLVLGKGRDEVFLYNDTGDMYFSNIGENLNTVIDIGLFDEIAKKRTVTNWIDTIQDRYGRHVFNLVLKINSLKKFNNIGFLACQICEYELENIYQNIIQDDADIYIVNESGQILSHKDKNRISTMVDETVMKSILIDDHISDQNQFVFYQQINETGWYLVGQYSRNILESDSRDLAYNKVYFFALILFITLILAYIFAFGLTRSLHRICEVLHRMKMFELSVAFPSEAPIAEVKDLRDAFDEMIIRNEQLIVQLMESSRKQSELETRKRTSEMTALQYQINPHFMYNSFESLNWLIKRDRKADAVHMVSSLSQFLRHVTRAYDPVVPISEEIAHAKHYIAIMNMRYNEQIEYYWDVDETIMDAMTIRLSLQPTIENAIYHGIHPRESHGVIEISCRTEDDGKNIVFLVTDNGVGITAEKIKKIMDDIRREESTESIGLHNIHSRITLYFGEEYGIRIFSRENMGTTVEIRIPNTKYEKNE